MQTSKGLPNSCSNCGQTIKEKEWFAPNEDEARSGLGLCVTCATEKKGSGDGRTADTGDNLTRVDGIGSKTANSLKAIGISNLTQLAEADTNWIATSLGKSAEIVNQWQAEAAQFIG